LIASMTFWLVSMSKPTADYADANGSISNYRGARTPVKKAPPLETSGGVLATSYSRTAYRRTTIGAAAFHCRVRNGNGWGHCAIVTRNLLRNPGQISGA